MYKAKHIKYILQFKNPSGTSRGVLTEKVTYFLKLWKEDSPNIVGIGECGLLKGLSYDDKPGYEEKLAEVCQNIGEYIDNLSDKLIEFPSICFGLETAIKDLQERGSRILFPSDFTDGIEGIPINGLIWMGDIGYMKEQLRKKVEEGFRCIKIKVGAIEFEEELKFIINMRKEYPQNYFEIRLDANGGFTLDAVYEKLRRLSKYNIHSIEQPIRQGNWEAMAQLCKESPIPIALDEELIGVNSYEEKEKLISSIKPQYIILKPSLLGGFRQCEQWIEIANKYKTGWWVTSALESNIGLNAISQWTYRLNSKLPQGLGTGKLYINNIVSPLLIEDSKLWYMGEGWSFDRINEEE
jgi:L-alanine-DL-glutamate epimerase-like enolase superfamily enzyme